MTPKAMFTIKHRSKPKLAVVVAYNETNLLFTAPSRANNGHWTSRNA